ncbi:MAG: GFA family protein [Limimaricola sp.]|uniref:GFA family protein n=1 Tax=Limimaricola sp. TaxID=2211665 RepID=UPI001D745E6B|nr:GFA family protein [Limimaricola sp.]MBI1417616.1 GFA family protein [Limimaricola sp.]
MLEGKCHCGKVHWTFDATPTSVTACNCTVCRRYGVLWIYGHEGEDVAMTGETSVYARADNGPPEIGFHFCPDCGCVVAWRALEPHKGRRRMAVNLRLTEPGPVAHLPIDHFEGLVTFDDLPRDGRCVADMWF